jgi:hypothetical protein
MDNVFRFWMYRHIWEKADSGEQFKGAAGWGHGRQGGRDKPREITRRSKLSCINAVTCTGKDISIQVRLGMSGEQNDSDKGYRE